jgi:glycosyltransferase involved in cell wall biosynthesis
MINGKRIAVVLPAYNAEKTLENTVSELPDVVDIKILVDDHSSDRTVEIAERLGTAILRARPELRIRAQPTDLLPRSASGRR